MNRVLLSAALALSLAATSSAWTLVGAGGKGARVIVGSGEPLCVRRAAADLTNDVARITGVRLPISVGETPSPGDVFISTVRRPEWESYAVSSSDGVLRMTGADERGTMFAVYDFIERYLGVDPLAFWSGAAYPKKSVLEWDKVEIVQGSPSFRFRGWFLNDEDFINAWKPWAGPRAVKRGIDFIDQVMNLDTLEHALEALVRSRMNMIIPSSYFDPGNPPDVETLDRIAARGVFVTQHHHDPLGMSGFVFDNKYKYAGKKEIYSYHKNPEALRKEWRWAAGVYSSHNPNVVWQIGIRGHSDSPTWKSDPTMPKTDEGRAKIISDAMREQVAILNDLGYSGDRLFMTATLWAEGSYFNRLGLLDIPSGATVIFSDNSPGWVWPEDFYKVKRRKDLKYGVYYHHQLISSGPHVCSMIPATRTYKLLREAYDTGANEYVIFNVGNIREFCYGIDDSAKITWNIEKFDAKRWQRDWVARGVGEDRADDWSRVLDLYYNSFAIHPVSGTPCYLDGHLYYYGLRGRKPKDRQAREDVIKPIIAALKAYVAGTKPKLRVPADATDGSLAVPYDKDPMQAALIPLMHPQMISRGDQCRRLAAQYAGFQQALRFAEALLAETPAEHRDFAIDQLVFPIRIMHLATAAVADANVALDALNAADVKRCVATLRRTLAIYEAILAMEGERNRGKWAGWWNQSIHQRIDWKKNIADIKEALAIVEKGGGK